VFQLRRLPVPLLEQQRPKEWQERQQLMARHIHRKMLNRRDFRDLKNIVLT
jgi:hypothetical protein